MAAKKYVVVVNYDPEVIDRGIVADAFDMLDHDGGGYCFVDRTRDEDASTVPRE